MTTGPEHTRGWLGMLMPVLERGSAVTLLVLLLLGGLTIYGMFLEMKRVHGHNETLVRQALDDKQAQIEWLRRMSRCTPAP